MSAFLQLFLWIPLIGFFVSLFIPGKNEKLLASIAIGTSAACLGLFGVFITYWLLQGAVVLDRKHITLFQAEDIEIFIDFYFDKVTAVFAFIGMVITLLIAIFSRYYLHRDGGYKRYFCTILLFFLSYNMLVFAGNFETLFMGWEVLGICSFLLIGLYRDRYLPVKNSLKVMSVYRLGDICLILAMWMSHHIWHENITFMKLNDTALVLEHIVQHNWYAFFIAVMIFIAASVKSAQLPFSSWLPRAMEGPTSSSALFYGALSVHLGVFLLLRTYPYWESLILIKIAIGITGLTTSLIAISIAKVQSSVKVQIAYASIAQIGLMFIEIALGFHNLALLHFAGNAFLRTYQLLVSPSVLSYRMHDMVFSFTKKEQAVSEGITGKLKNTVYMLSLKEWNLDFLLYSYVWNPFKWAGKKLQFLTTKPVVFVLMLLFLAGLFSYYFQESVPVSVIEFSPHIFSCLALLLILAAFADKGDAIHAWLSVIASQLFMTLSIAFLNENFGHNYMLIYLSGSLISALSGWICLKKIKSIDQNIRLDQFHGYAYRHPTISFIFLLSCLGLLGLPFTPTFVGIDILFSHIHKHEEIIILLTSLSFLIVEISILRIYARIFMGQDKHTDHAMAYRSS